jgi:DNA invertase Pin-like site-specific DNA recombinase
MTAPANVTSRDFSARRRVRRVAATPTPGVKAALYLRVSTEEQAREGVSLDAQEARLRAYALAHGLEVSVTFCDSGVSGSIPLGERPQGAELLAALERGEVQHVLAFKLDRLFRDAVDCLRTVRQWDDAGSSMHLVDMGGQAVNTGSAVGRFFLGMLAGVAELERSLISERVSMALQHKISKGERVGAPPYGYAATGDGTEWVAVPDELAVLDEMRAMRSTGATIAAIADNLNRRGVAAKRSQTWHTSSVCRALARSV